MLDQQIHNLHSMCAVKASYRALGGCTYGLGSAPRHVYRGSELGTLSIHFLTGTHMPEVVLELWDSTLEMGIGDRHPRWCDRSMCNSP